MLLQKVYCTGRKKRGEAIYNVKGSTAKPRGGSRLFFSYAVYNARQADNILRFSSRGMKSTLDQKKQLTGDRLTELTLWRTVEQSIYPYPTSRPVGCLVSVIGCIWFDRIKTKNNRCVPSLRRIRRRVRTSGGRAYHVTTLNNRTRKCMIGAGYFRSRLRYVVWLDIFGPNACFYRLATIRYGGAANAGERGHLNHVNISIINFIERLFLVFLIFQNEVEIMISLKYDEKLGTYFCYWSIFTSCK